MIAALKNSQQREKWRLSLPLQLTLVAVSYFASAELGLALATLNKTASPVWPATGVAITCVYLWGRRMVPAIFIAAFCANYLNGSPIALAGLIAGGNALEALAASWIIKNFTLSRQISYLADAMAVVAGSVGGGVISASIGTSALVILGGLPQESLLTTWTTWLTGDALGGILLIMPCLHLSSSLRDGTINFQRGMKSLGVAVGVLVAVFGILKLPENVPGIFLLFPLGLAIAWRFGFGTALMAQIVILMTCIWATAIGVGPFTLGTTNENLVTMQLFLGGLSITGLFLAGFARAGALRAPTIVLTLGWFVTALLFQSFRNAEVIVDATHFEELVKDAEAAVQDRLTSYQDSLNAGEALYAAIPSITRSIWSQFAKTINVGSAYPGINGIGVVYVVPGTERSAFEARAAADGFPEFKVKSVPGHSLAESGLVSFVITYLEPLESNRAAIGLDLASEINRRAGAELARDSGLPAISGTITLVQDQSKRPGFLLYKPLYKGNVVPKTITDRQHAHVGFMYAPFVSEDFFKGALSRILNELDVKIYDGESLSESAEIFRSISFAGRADQGPSEHDSTILLGQRPLRLVWTRGPGFISTIRTQGAWGGSIAVFMVLFLAILVANLQLTRSKAESLATEMTSELRDQKIAFADQALTMSSIMNLAPVGIFSVSESGAYQYTNSEWKALLGAAEDNNSGDHWLDSVHSEDLTKVEMFWRRHLAGIDARSIEYRLRGNGGAVKEIILTMVPQRTMDGKLSGFLGTTQDMTELRQAQRTVEDQRAIAFQAAKMSSLGEMAGGVAHEINNPLAIIQGTVDQLARVFREQKDDALDRERICRQIDRIKTTTIRISKIVKGLRSFSRSGENDPFADVALKTILGESLELCGERFKNSGVDLQIGEIPEAILRCRSVQIGQTLINLLNNAFDAVQKYERKWVRVEAMLKGDSVEVVVTDSGNGIPVDVVAKMMQPFFTTKDVGKGTGLGLSISLGIIQDHRGTLQFDSSCPNTRFVITLPVMVNTQGIERNVA